MKKTYCNPVIKVVMIQTQQMLASSTTVGINRSGDAVNAGDAASRGYDFDDDDY